MQEVFWRANSRLRLQQFTRRPLPPVTGEQNSASVASEKGIFLERNVSRFWSRTLAVSICLAAVCAFIGFKTVRASSSQGAQLVPANATIASATAPKISAPGTALYEAKR